MVFFLIEEVLDLVVFWMFFEEYGGEYCEVDWEELNWWFWVLFDFFER